MIRKTVEFSTPGTRLSVALKQLVVERPEMPKATLPIEDLGVVIVDDARATYTQAVFLDLLAAGATVMVTGRDHLPAGMMLPLDAHHVQTERHRAQVEISLPTKKRIWQALISTKIAQQGAVLVHFRGDHFGLLPLSKRVRSGDPDNLEAQAAQRYWPNLFGKEFRRDRGAEGINALLNYGYAVMRAAIARAVVASGLLPSLGVFHSNRSNPFCLADDLLEPYRPFVDWRVRLLVNERDGEVPNLDDRSVRAAQRDRARRRSAQPDAAGYPDERRLPQPGDGRRRAGIGPSETTAARSQSPRRRGDRLMTDRRPTPQLPWGWRSMWVIAMFDLPVDTPTTRKAYTRFRKTLLEDGFTMMQYSVYSRHCASIENADMHVRRMGDRVPSEGEVRFLTITDRQFGRIQVFAGKKRQPTAPSPSQMELF